MLKDRIFLSGLVVLFTLVSASAQISFSQLTLDEAKVKAASEQKNILLDFRADWCKPCLAMEKTTFQDKNVGKTINANYISLKIDVDYFTGMDLQEEYNVSVLPTILIINSYGEVQKRLIGEKTATSLLSELGHTGSGKRADVSTDREDTSDPKVKTTSKKESKFLRWWKNLWN